LTNQRDNIVTQKLIKEIKSGDEKAFEEVFRLYYGPLLNMGRGLTRDEQLAEEQVQEVFVRLWEKRETLKDDLKLFPYLLTSVRNRCYNLTRNNQVAQKYVNFQQKQYQDEILHYDYENEDDETIVKIHAAIENMPEKCQEVFKLSRFEGLSHKQIAEKLSISVKTIENHITKAMKLLKNELLLILITLFYG